MNELINPDIGPGRLELSSVQSQTGVSIYHIHIKGHLDQNWSGWLDNLVLSHEADGVTLLSGPLADQAALLGLLCRLHDLGLTILSVTCILKKMEEVINEID